MFRLGKKRWHIEVGEDDSAGIIEEFKNEGAAQVEKKKKKIKLKSLAYFIRTLKLLCLANIYRRW